MVFSDLVMSCTDTFPLYSQAFNFVCAVIIIMRFVTIERNRMHKKPIKYVICGLWCVVMYNIPESPIYPGLGID